MSNDLVFTTLFQGELVALNLKTGAIVYKKKLPDTTNSTIAIAGDTVLVPAAGVKAFKQSGVPQLVAYTVAGTR